MTALIIQALILIIIILLFAIFVGWLYRIGQKRKEEFVEKTIDKAFSLLTSKISVVKDWCNAGPWYLVVYTEESSHPIWISNNNIRSIHPDALHLKLIVKQFNGEDMVIENVINYEMQSANDMGDYEM